MRATIELSSKKIKHFLNSPLSIAKPLLLIALLSSGPSYADPQSTMEQAVKVFKERWDSVLIAVKKPNPLMQSPSTHIAISFTAYQFDIPTYGLHAVEYYDGKVTVSYKDNTYLIITIERRYNFPPDTWTLPLETTISCLTNPQDKLPLACGKLSATFKYVREGFWKGIEWTKFRKTPSNFTIHQMYRNFFLLENNLAYLVPPNARMEVIGLKGNIKTEVFEKIADSTRFRAGL
ncbi:MAG: hypothetical protein V4525_01825 [Pseudomonadota bacterium]